MRGIKARDPMKTRNGRTRLGPLNLAQVEEMIEKTSSKKEKGRLRQKADQLRSKRLLTP